jgi:hypothetical protein
VPGPQGPAGTNGTNGTNGVNAFSQVVTQFAIPGQLLNVTVNAPSQWMTATQVIAVQFAGTGGTRTGYYEVVSKPDTTHVILKNLRNNAATAYQDNIDGVATPGNIPVGAFLSPGGVQGPMGPSVAANPGLYSGNGSPEGVVTAVPGSIYTDVLTGNIYKKLTGNGNTGWG